MNFSAAPARPGERARSYVRLEAVFEAGESSVHPCLVAEVVERSADVSFVRVKDAIAERGRDRRRPIVPDRAEHLARRTVAEAAHIRQEVDEPFVVDGVVGGEAGDRIDPILGQTEIGLEANDRKRQVEPGVHIKITSAEGAVELEVRWSNRNPYSSESGEDAFRQLQGGVVAEQRACRVFEIGPRSDARQNDVEARNECVVACYKGGHQPSLEMLKKLEEIDVER